MFVFQLAEYQKKQNLLTYFNGMLGMVWPEDKWLLFGADPDPGADQGPFMHYLLEWKKSGT